MGREGWARPAQALSGDRVAAIDYTTDEIKVFSTDGLVATLGGAGEGHGEFAGLYHFWRLPGDTLLAMDRSLYRVSRFGPEGTFEGVVTIEPDPLPLPRPVGVLPDGRFVGVTRAAPVWAAPEGTVTAQDETFVVLGPDGERGSTIAQEQGGRVRMMVDGEGRRFSAPVFAGFGPAPSQPSEAAASTMVSPVATRSRSSTPTAASYA